jgi:hypothetical protein
MKDWLAIIMKNRQEITASHNESETWRETNMEKPKQEVERYGDKTIHSKWVYRWVNDIC